MAWKPKFVKTITAKNHIDYLREAYDYAEKNSDDTSTHNAALIVNSLDEIIVYGVNHFFEGIEKTKERLERPLKYSFIEHAERDAIYYAAKNGIAIDGMKMYMPWLPCDNCARAIIGSGIVELIGHKDMIMKTEERWHDSLDQALEMLHEAKVDVKMYDGKIDGCTALFSGVVWYP